MIPRTAVIRSFLGREGIMKLVIADFSSSYIWPWLLILVLRNVSCLMSGSSIIPHSVFHSLSSFCSTEETLGNFRVLWSSPSLGGLNIDTAVFSGPVAVTAPYTNWKNSCVPLIIRRARIDLAKMRLSSIISTEVTLICRLSLGV